MKLLVTGGAGFIGSHFVRQMLASDTALRIVNVDALTYAGNLENLADVAQGYADRYTFVRADIADRDRMKMLIGAEKPDAIVNFAAETHVDRSVLDPADFIHTNIVGTQSLLEAARAAKTPRFVQVSTDEVYGSLGTEGRFTEETPLAPNSPYATSKAGADFLCRAYCHTFGLDVRVTRCSNNYGPNQFPEKLIPLMIANALEGKELPVYGDGSNVRDWLHVLDHCAAIRLVLEKGRAGEVYNIGGCGERHNLDVVKTLLGILGKPESLIRFVKDRPGHDWRYAIDSTKLQRELGWRPRIAFEEGLAETVAWYREHRACWERVRSGAYRDYYEKNYAEKMK